MSLWVDKHRPLKLQQLSHSPELTLQLKSIADKAADMPHLLVYGQSGVGKKTRVRSLLKAIYGSSVDKMNIYQKQYSVTNGGSTTTKIDCTIMSSLYHLEMTPSESGPTQDRLVIQEVIKEIASSGNVLSSGSVVVEQLEQQSASVPSFKVIVLHDADGLSQQAQHALRRTMEKFSRQVRLVLIAENTSRLLAPIRSRCLGIRVAAPSREEGAAILQNVAEMENVRVTGSMVDVMATIYELASYNLRRALLMLEAAHVQQKGGMLSSKTEFPLPDYSEFIKHIAKIIKQEQSNAVVLKVRGMMYEIISKCIPPAVILKELTFALIELSQEDNCRLIVEYAAFYDERLRLGTTSKAIYHLEAFVVKVMAQLKRSSLMNQL